MFFNINCISKLFTSILSTLPRQNASTGGKTSAEIIDDLAGDILEKLPVDYNKLIFQYQSTAGHIDFQYILLVH